MHQTTRSRGGGRPSKGARHDAKVRFPKDHYARYLAEAEEAGLDFSSYIVRLCASASGLEVPKWAVPAPQPEGDQPGAQGALLGKDMRPIPIGLGERLAS